MKGVVSYIAIAILSLVAVHEFSRAKATSAEAEFLPTTAIRLVVPEGTPIQAVLKNLFTTSTKRGDSVRAFVTEQVMVNGSVAIPAGSRLDGTVEMIATTKSMAQVSLRFNSLLIGQTPWPIKTEPVETNASIESDFEILSNALGTVASTGFGVAIGAAGGTQGGVAAGMTAGAMRAATVDPGNIKITVILAEPLDLIR